MAGLLARAGTTEEGCLGEGAAAARDTVRTREKYPGFSPHPAFWSFISIFHRPKHLPWWPCAKWSFLRFAQLAAGKENVSIRLWSFVSCNVESACFRREPGRRAELRGRGGQPEGPRTPGPPVHSACSRPACSPGFLVTGGQEFPSVYSRFNLVCPLKCEMKVEFSVGSIVKQVLNSCRSAPLLGCTNQPRGQRCVPPGSLQSEEACGVGWREQHGQRE